MPSSEITGTRHTCSVQTYMIARCPYIQNKNNFMRHVDVDEPKHHTINKTGKASLEPQLKPQGTGNSQLFTNQRI